MTSAVTPGFSPLTHDPPRPTVTTPPSSGLTSTVASAFSAVKNSRRNRCRRIRRVMVSRSGMPGRGEGAMSNRPRSSSSLSL